MSRQTQSSSGAALPFHVAAFYQFTKVPAPDALVEELSALMAEIGQQSRDQSGIGLCGTVLVASEGINGTLAGTRQVLESVFEHLQALGFDQLMRRNTRAAKAPFHRLKVRLKKEIVSMGQGDLDPDNTGRYVEPEHWDALISDPAVTVIDTRNDYETTLGTFSGAVKPGTRSFREFPDWANTHLSPDENPKVAMFCTGGIRCEKATAYLKSQGFEEVLHLRGGILNYLEQVPAERSSWQGACFVFDDRVTVDHQLKAGHHEQCFNCRMPLMDEDLKDPRYERHVSCPHCHHRVDDRRRAGLLERARQMALAEARGQQHLGADMPATDQALAVQKTTPDE